MKLFTAGILIMMLGLSFAAMAQDELKAIPKTCTDRCAHFNELCTDYCDVLGNESDISNCQKDCNTVFSSADGYCQKSCEQDKNFASPCPDGEGLSDKTAWECHDDSCEVHYALCVTLCPDTMEDDLPACYNSCTAAFAEKSFCRYQCETDPGFMEVCE